MTRLAHMLKPSASHWQPQSPQPKSLRCAPSSLPSWMLRGASTSVRYLSRDFPAPGHVFLDSLARAFKRPGLLFLVASDAGALDATALNRVREPPEILVERLVWGAPRCEAKPVHVIDSTEEINCMRNTTLEEINYRAHPRGYLEYSLFLTIITHWPIPVLKPQPQRPCMTSPW